MLLLSLWPRDRLCFLWNTFCQKLGPNCVNDVIVYVPSTLFHCFREALSQVKEEHMPTGHLHWLSLCPALTDHVWLEFNFTHPANTSKTANPRYRITGRPMDRTPVETGKFL